MLIGHSCAGMLRSRRLQHDRACRPRSGARRRNDQCRQHPAASIFGGNNLPGRWRRLTMTGFFFRCGTMGARYRVAEVWTVLQQLVCAPARMRCREVVSSSASVMAPRKFAPARRLPAGAFSFGEGIA